MSDDLDKEVSLRIKTYESNQHKEKIDRLRDDFAKAALQGIIASAGACTENIGFNLDASAAYKYAQAMLQERKKYVDS